MAYAVEWASFLESSGNIITLNLTANIFSLLLIFMIVQLLAFILLLLFSIETALVSEGEGIKVAISVNGLIASVNESFLLLVK